MIITWINKKGTLLCLYSCYTAFYNSLSLCLSLHFSLLLSPSPSLLCNLSFFSFYCFSFIYHWFLFILHVHIIKWDSYRNRTSFFILQIFAIYLSILKFVDTIKNVTFKLYNRNIKINFWMSRLMNLFLFISFDTCILNKTIFCG